MPARVLVVGGGAAGTAAAFAAARAGGQVTVLVGAPAATELGSGAFDDSWPPSFGEETRPPGPLSEPRESFFEALALYRLSPRSAEVATLSGRIRGARGCDFAVLDLADLAPGRVLVPRVDRADWDADALCRSYAAHASGRARSLVFEPSDAPILRRSYELHLSAIDLARTIEEPDRPAWLADRLAPHVTRPDVRAVLVGPWLALDRSLLTELRERLGKPIGETLSPPGGPAGPRFERARDRLFASLGIRAFRSRLVGLAAGAASTWSAREGAGDSASYDAVVLATGGLLGGGVAFADSPEAAIPGLVAAPPGIGVVGVHGRALEAASSAFGIPGEELDLATAEGRGRFARIGLLALADGRMLDRARAPIPRLFGAGDLLADRPRCLGEAIDSGLAAGAAAARG